VLCIDHWKTAAKISYGRYRFTVNPCALTRTFWSNLTVACVLVPNRGRTLSRSKVGLKQKCLFPFLRKCDISAVLAKFRSRTPIFAKTFAVTNISVKICQNLMSSKYFHKNGPIVLHVDDKFCLFCINPKSRDPDP
jgi:hypothetical protein